MAIGICKTCKREFKKQKSKLLNFYKTNKSKMIENSILLKKIKNKIALKKKDKCKVCGDWFIAKKYKKKKNLRCNNCLEKKINICRFCKNIFYQKYYTEQFCCLKHKNEYRKHYKEQHKDYFNSKRRRKIKAIKIAICKYCGKEFEFTGQNQKYCSRKHKELFAYHKKSLQEQEEHFIYCKTCNKKIIKPRKGRIYCNELCKGRNSFYKKNAKKYYKKIMNNEILLKERRRKNAETRKKYMRKKRQQEKTSKIERKLNSIKRDTFTKWQILDVLKYANLQKLSECSGIEKSVLISYRNRDCYPEGLYLIKLEIGIIVMRKQG